jgi:ABC-type lipoprotein release transport system permease subunit
MIFMLALRNLYLQRKRHTLIAFAIMMGFALITVITGTASGSLESVRKKASRYFSGNASITGYSGSFAKITDPTRVIDVLHQSRLPIELIAGRTVYSKSDAKLFFNGETVRQRKLIGVDFSLEGPEFSDLQFTQGTWEDLASEAGKDGILISVAAAKILGCRVGDDLMLYLTTDSGQYNTARLFVRGVFNETSLFGYVAYMRRADLNRLLLRQSNEVTDIAVYAKASVEGEQFAEDVRVTLSNYFRVFPHFGSREERDKAVFYGSSKEETLAVLSQNAQLAQIKQLLDALLAVTYFTLAFFIIIIMVGILNTYRILVLERIKEIGTLRAIGMRKTQILFLFLFEAAILALVSSLVGFILGYVLLRILAIFNFSFIPAAGMFLKGGHFLFILDPRLVLTNVVTMVVAAVFAAFTPSNHAAHIAPAAAMRNN